MPADARETRRRILSTAERLFAEHGYDGVSLRRIARQAGAHLALIHYHFGNKADLYRAIWTHRYAEPYGSRFERLAALDFDRPRDEVVGELADILLILMQAMSDPDGQAFLRLMAREIGDPRESERGIIAEYLDPRAHRLIEAFRRALPELTLAEIVWCYQASAGVMLMHAVDTDRASRLSQGAAKSGDVEAALPVMREFIVGGWLALARKRSKS